MRVIRLGIYYSPLIQVALLSLFPAWIISRKVYHDEAGNAQAKWSQNTRAKESHFGLKNSVLLRCLSTELVAARSVQLFA